MKKTFELKHEKVKTPRVVEGIKHEVKKYLKRERRKTLPEGADFWDFECRGGPSAEEAQTIHVADINKFIDSAEKEERPQIYLEILAKEGHRR